MRILAINGSPREGGNTDTVIREIMGSVEDNDDFRYVHLADLDINDCNGCKSCKQSPGCIQEDDMQSLYGELERADMLLIGSPIYMGAETGRLKCFCDRLYAFLESGEEGFNSRLEGEKRAVVFFSCNNNDGNVVYYSMNARYSRVLKVLLGFDDVHTFIIPGVSNHDSILDSTFAQQTVDMASKMISGELSYD